MLLSHAMKELYSSLCYIYRTTLVYIDTCLRKAIAILPPRVKAALFHPWAHFIFRTNGSLHESLPLLTVYLITRPSVVASSEECRHAWTFLHDLRIASSWSRKPTTTSICGRGAITRGGGGGGGGGGCSRSPA